MADDTLIQILGKSGANNVSDPKCEDFAPASQGKPREPFLTHAVNVDIDRSGTISRRVGRTKLRTLTRGSTGVSFQGDFYYGDNGSILRYRRGESSDETIISGLNQYADISWTEHAGQLFWSNGYEVGRIVGGVASFWGLAATDPPTLTATNGGLRAGRYLVAVSDVRSGVESGVRESSEITLNNDSAGIAVSGSFDPQADHLNVYCSDTNGAELFFVKSVPVGSFTIDQVSTTTRIFTGLGAYPPPAGHMARSWNGFLLVATSGDYYGNAIYFSEPGAPHRFKPSDRLMLPARPVLVEPFPDGFFYALESGATYWVSGTDPRKIQRQQVDNRVVSEGQAARIPARKIPWLQAPADTVVAVWGTSDGLAVGLPGGTVRHPTDGIYATDAMKKSTVAYAERPGLRQLLLSARERSMETRLGVGDLMTMTITRGGLPV